MWSAELSVERVPGYKDEQCTEAMFAVLLIWASSCYSWLASNFGWIRLLNNQQWPPEFSAECAQIGPTKEWIAYLGVCNLYVCVGQDRHTYSTLELEFRFTQPSEDTIGFLDRWLFHTQPGWPEPYIIHRICLYIWWFPSKQYRMYTVYVGWARTIYLYVYTVYIRYF